MTTYNYMEAMVNDIHEYIINEIELYNYATLEDLEEYLNEVLWTEDSVTGNASGSYTFNRYKAEEYLCHNFDLLAEAMEEFCCSWDELKKGAEWADVTIRCYLLGQAIAEAMKEVEEPFNLAHGDE